MIYLNALMRELWAHGPRAIEMGHPQQAGPSGEQKEELTVFNAPLPPCAFYHGCVKCVQFTKANKERFQGNREAVSSLSPPQAAAAHTVVFILGCCC